MTSKQTLNFYFDLGSRIVEPTYLKGVKYEILDLEEFKKIKDGGRVNQVYWSELLTRAHWASLTGIYRNTKWVQGILSSIENANFLSFSASLRALIESSGDSMTSLLAIPKSLAEHYRNINESLSGNLKNKVHLAPELEANLIHFVYAQSVARKDREMHQIPDSHIAKFNSDYISILDNNKREGPIHQLYKLLCQITHPAALSVLYSMSERTKGSVTELAFVDDSDKKAINHLLESHAEDIETICQYGFNNCLILLKTLNLFGITGITTPRVDDLSFDHIKSWVVIKNKIAKA